MENANEDIAVPYKKARGKPKVLKEWLEQDVFKLISLVEDEKCLWDVGDCSYHNKMLRDSAWLKIADIFSHKYEAAECTAKWSNLRIQFRGYAGRAKTKSGQGAIETPKWRFYNAMSFVGRAEDQQTPVTVSNIVAEAEIESVDCDATPTPVLQKSQTPIKRCKQQAVNTQSAATQIAETMREAITAMKESRQDSSGPNYTFCKYLLSELETLSAEAAASVRNKVVVFFLQCLEEERSVEKIGFEIF